MAENDDSKKKSPAAPTDASSENQLKTASAETPKPAEEQETAQGQQQIHPPEVIEATTPEKVELSEPHTEANFQENEEDRTNAAVEETSVLQVKENGEEASVEDEEEPEESVTNDVVEGEKSPELIQELESASGQVALAVLKEDNGNNEGRTMAENKETAGLDFLDFLFTVAISVGLTPEVLQVTWVTGLLSEPWQKEGRFPNCEESFYIGVFGLAILNLILSWFGYHASIKSRPLNYFSGYGMVRFILDVVLIVMYGIALVKYRSFHVVLFIFVLVYWIYVIWDLLKIGEYWKTKEVTDKPLNYFFVRFKVANRKFPEKDCCSRIKVYLLVYRREIVSGFCAVLFTLFWMLFYIREWEPGGYGWSILIAVIIITVFYRLNKNYPILERCIFGIKDDLKKEDLQPEDYKLNA